jgi:hypothetical protein
MRTVVISNETNTTGVLVIVIAAIVASVTSWPWPMIATFVGVVSCGLIIYVNIIRPRRRRAKLAHPVDAYFLIADQRHHDCEYAAQDDEEHRVKEIVVSSNSEVIVDLVLDPKISFISNTILFGCLGDSATKPYAVEYLNRFVEIGSGKRVNPECDDTKHIIDKHHLYHVRDDPRPWSLGVCGAIGFKLKTTVPGTYPVLIGFLGDDTGGEALGLTITVEDAPKTPMRCILVEHRKRPCARGIKPISKGAAANSR